MRVIKPDGSRKACYAHTPRAVVLFQGATCPFCDELEKGKAQASYKDPCWKPKPQVSYAK